MLLSKPLCCFALALMETSPPTSARLARAFQALNSAFLSVAYLGGEAIFSHRVHSA